MNSLLQLKTSIRGDIWAGTEAENLNTAHNHAFLEALSQIQKAVPCFREHQANVVLFCNTYFKCGRTIVRKPSGIIDFVYTIANDDWCDPVFYTRATLQEVECYRDDCRTFEDPANEGMPTYPMGFKRSEATTDTDVGRARSGLWALDNYGKIVLAPWIQSNETVVVEWHGEKSATAWADEDPVSEEVDFRQAVKLYVQYAHERDYGEAQKALAFHNPLHNGSFDEALSELMVRCHNETAIREDKACRRCPTWAQITDDVVPT